MSVKTDRVKILVVGDSGVGKTSFVHSLCHGAPLRRPSWTVGCNVDVKLVNSSDGPVVAELWDVTGAVTARDARPVLYTDADAIILVHDLSNHVSFQNLRRWIREIAFAIHHHNSSPAAHSGQSPAPAAPARHGNSATATSSASAAGARHMRTRHRAAVVANAASRASAGGNDGASSIISGDSSPRGRTLSTLSSMHGSALTQTSLVDAPLTRFVSASPAWLRALLSPLFAATADCFAQLPLISHAARILAGAASSSRARSTRRLGRTRCTFSLRATHRSDVSGGAFDFPDLEIRRGDDLIGVLPILVVATKADVAAADGADDGRDDATSTFSATHLQSMSSQQTAASQSMSLAPSAVPAAVHVPRAGVGGDGNTSPSLARATAAAGADTSAAGGLMWPLRAAASALTSVFVGGRSVSSTRDGTGKVASALEQGSALLTACLDGDSLRVCNTRPSMFAPRSAPTALFTAFVERARQRRAVIDASLSVHHGHAAGAAGSPASTGPAVASIGTSRLKHRGTGGRSTGSSANAADRLDMSGAGVSPAASPSAPWMAGGGTPGSGAGLPSAIDANAHLRAVASPSSSRSPLTAMRLRALTPTHTPSGTPARTRTPAHSAANSPFTPLGAHACSASASTPSGSNVPVVAATPFTANMRATMTRMAEAETMRIDYSDSDSD